MRIFLSALIGVPTLGVAQIVYDGLELQAIRCADFYATAALELKEEMTTEERTILFTKSAYILAEYVSGTWQDKDAALKQVVERRSVEEALDGFRNQGATCEETFPTSP